MRLLWGVLAAILPTTLGAQHMDALLAALADALEVNALEAGAIVAAMEGDAE